MRYREMKLRVTKDSIEEFKDSVLWKDMKRELGVWKKMAGDELISLAQGCSGIEDLTQVARIGGRIEAINYMLEMPDIFLQEINDARRNETD
jgi:hypothetical protein